MKGQLRMVRSKSIPCPMCDKQFPLPLRWSHPPFQCPCCHEQLQATVRFELLLRYVLVVAVAPVCFLGWLNGSLFWYSLLYLFGFLLVYAVASSLSAAVFPLAVKPYQPSVTGLNATK